MQAPPIFQRPKMVEYRSLCALPGVQVGNGVLETDKFIFIYLLAN
ncbi:MAG: hypothetical protein JWQ01_2959 [Massilia sp.]|nr:hypothetical protein [Massilia sp.]